MLEECSGGNSECRTPAAMSAVSAAFVRLVSYYNYTRLNSKLMNDVMNETDEKFYNVLRELKRLFELQPRLDPHINLVGYSSPLNKVETESIINTLRINWNAFGVVVAPKGTMFVEEEELHRHSTTILQLN